MLNKLENARLNATTAKTGRLIAACLISAGILTGSALSVNSAPQATGFNSLTLHELVEPGIADLSLLHNASWRKGRGGPGMLQKLSDAEIEERLTRVVRHVAIEIDATPEQVEEIVAIVTPVAIGLKETQRELSTVGEDLRSLLLSKDVDRFAIESLRAEKLALADTVSKEVMAMMIDVAAVLTPEQRVQLDERIKEFRAMGPRFRHR